MRADEGQRSPALIFGVIAAAACVLLTLRDPMMPSGGLDGSWQLATEFAARRGLVFGREYVFTYGPFHFLATRLFDPATWPWVLLSEALSVVAIFWAALRNRSSLAVAGLVLCVILLQMQFDSLTGPALFGVFLICLQGRGLWTVAVVALCAPLVLAKLSFGLVLLPLLLLADAERLLARRPPLLTLTLLLSAFAAYLLAGQPLAGIVPFVAGGLESTLGYGRAMQLPGAKGELAFALLLSGASVAAAGYAAFRAWRIDASDLRPVVAVAGLAWLLFVSFKMGFVRQDPHTLIFHQAAPVALAMAYGFLARRDATRHRALALLAMVFLVFLGTSVYWRSYHLRPAASDPVPVGREVAQAVSTLGARLGTGIAQATGQRSAELRAVRARATTRISRPFPDRVSGSVDAIPWDAAPLIASGLDYRPRPAIQSYSAYTAGLQGRDLEHFAGPRAPDTLILRLEAIDGRLPTLELGPSLPVIGRRYDAVGDDPLGLILKRRAAPRAMSVRTSAAYSLPLETWVGVPAVEGRLLMARIKVRRSLAGRLVGLAYREPLMAIHLRTASGREVSYRFVPDMAQLGVAVSPLPGAWTGGAPVLLDPAWSVMGERVAALRIVTAGQGWAFRDATIAFEDIGFEPGFAGRLGGLPLIGAQLAASDRSKAATFDGKEIFAHAPTTLSTTFAEPVRLRGVAGMRPQPPGTPLGDGVRFVATLTPPGGAPTVLFDTRIAPRGAPAPFQIDAPAGSRLQLETMVVGTGAYDWSYWGQLELAP